MLTIPGADVKGLSRTGIVQGMGIKTRLERLETNRKHEAQLMPTSPVPTISRELWMWLFSTGEKPEVLDDSAKPWLREHVDSTKGDVMEWLHG